MAGRLGQHDGPAVVACLKASLSHLDEQRNPAEQQMTEWEKLPGYMSLLLEVVRNADVDFNIRQAAGVAAKNHVDRHWRPSDIDPVSEEEKVYVRNQLLELLGIEDKKLIKLVAASIGRVSRFDVPDFWSDLIPTLVSMVQNAEESLSKSALLALHHVVKEQVSRRRDMEIKLFHAFASQLSSFLIACWDTYVQKTLDRLAALESLTAEDVELFTEDADMALLCLKVVRQVIRFGFPRFDDRPEILEFFANLLGRLEVFVELRNRLPKDAGETGALAAAVKAVEAHMNKSVQAVNEVAGKHPLSFVPVLRPYLAFFFQQIQAVVSVEHNLSKDFIIGCLTFISSVDKQDKYTNPRSQVSKVPGAVEIMAEGNAIVGDFFTADTLTQLVQVVVENFMPLTEADLEEWDANPEGYVTDRTMDNALFDLRPCAIGVLTSLVQNHKDVLTPFLVQKILEASNTPVQDMQTAVYKDAWYHAAGVTSFDLHHLINFPDWLLNSLAAEASANVGEGELKILRRRIVWLIGEWVVQVKGPEVQRAAYTLILHILAGDDLVLRLTCVQTLHHLIDDLDFSVEVFLEFAEPSLELTYRLLQDCEDVDAKLRAINFMSVIVDRMHDQIRPLASKLAETFPSLWETVQELDMDMLKTAIVCTSVKIVKSLGMYCPVVYNFILPLIKHSTDIDSRDAAYIMCEGLELWEMTLKCSAELTPALSELFIALPGVIESGMGEFKVCIKVMKSYLMLGGNPFMQEHAERVRDCLERTLTEVRDDGILITLPVLQVLFQLHPEDGPTLMTPLLRNFLTEILNRSSRMVVLVGYINVFARVLLQNPAFFSNFFDAMSNTSGKNVLTLFLDEWLDRWDHIGNPMMRKMGALALSTLVATSDGDLLKKVPDILVTVVGVMCEAEELASPIRKYLADEPSTTCEEEPEIDRIAMLSKTDPVTILSLRQVLQEKLHECRQLNGEKTYTMLLQSLPESVLQQLSTFVRL